MYEARSNVRRIIKLIIKKENEIDPILTSLFNPMIQVQNQ